VIAPEIYMHDLDPVGFARLNGRFGRHDTDEVTITVLHEGGVVQHAVHSTRGAVDVGDRTGDAGEMRAHHGVDRVVLLDRRLLDDLSSGVVDLARACATQGELLWRSRELWNAHPAVEQSPAPQPSRWPAVSERLARVPDGAWVVANINDGANAYAFVIGGRVEGGVFVEMTSAIPEGATVAATITASLGDDPSDAVAWLDEVTAWS
jgi:hypothetical protein